MMPCGDSVSAALRNSFSSTSATSIPRERADSSSATPRGESISLGAARTPLIESDERSSSSTARIPSTTNTPSRSRAFRRRRSRARVNKRTESGWRTADGGWGNELQTAHELDGHLLESFSGRLGNLQYVVVRNDLVSQPRREIRYA